MTLDSKYRHYSTHLNQIINPQFITPEEQAKEEIIFGIKINQSIQSKRQNIYCLYLLLLKYGEPEHKLIMLNQIRECRENLSLKLKKLREMNGGCKNLECKKLQIESLQFLDKDLSEQAKQQPKSDENKFENKILNGNTQNKNKSVNHPKQKQFIINGLIALNLNKNELIQNPQTQEQNNKYDIPKYLNKLLNIKEQIKKYHKFTVIEFSCEEFQIKNLSVFIEYNKQDKTLTYMKKYHQPSLSQNFLHDLSFFSQSNISNLENLENLESNCGLSQDADFIKNLGTFVSQQESVDQQQAELVQMDFTKRTSSQKINSHLLYAINSSKAKPRQIRQQVQHESQMKEESEDEPEDESEDRGIIYPSDSSSQQQQSKIRRKISYTHDEDDNNNQNKDQDENENEENNFICNSETKIAIFEKVETQQDRDQSWKYNLKSDMALTDYQLIEQNES